LTFFFKRSSLFCRFTVAVEKKVYTVGFSSSPKGKHLSVPKPVPGGGSNHNKVVAIVKKLFFVADAEEKCDQKID
jgi:hypothetical protein